MGELEKVQFSAAQAPFPDGTILRIMSVLMRHEEIVSAGQMKDAVTRNVGSKFPLKITLANGDVKIIYIRGFADQQRNIMLISDNSFSLAVKILELREIRTLEFGRENSEAEWTVLHAKWHRKANTKR